MKPPELSNLKTELVAEMAAAAEATRSSPTPSSDIHTSMTTLKQSTLSTLNKCANFQMSVLFQIEYSVMHQPEITITTAAASPPPQ